MNKNRTGYVSKKRSLVGKRSYCFIDYKYFDYSVFSNIRVLYRNGKKNGESFNDVIIMADTETSKETPNTVCRNYVVAWTISIRAYDTNIVTLYGTRPSEMVDCMNRIIMAMPGDNTVFYIQNLSYDWVFLRKFFMREWGTPEHQLNTKPHYPIFVEFGNGVTLRDSLILSQRSLEKWAVDMDVQHKKAVGFWDYDKIRNQGGRFTPNEKTYIEHDTLAGVECLQKTMDSLGKNIFTIPYTATGIPREIVRKLAKENRFRDEFLKIVPPYQVQLILELVYHGGYTHNNRHFIEQIIKATFDEDLQKWIHTIIAFDESSAYPYALLAFKYPMERFTQFENCKPEFILENAENYAYIFKLILVKPRLKNDFIPMPTLQKSKAVKILNGVEDNGRLLCAGYVEIYLNEVDLGVILKQYDYDFAYCVDVYFSKKDYLPRWFTDFVFQCFVDKTQLKGGDAVLYSIAKAKLNALYGMCCQKPVKQVIEEDYLSGKYSIDDKQDEETIYQKYIDNRNSVLPYQWGVWCTSYSFANLHEIGSYAGTWLYSDTDSCYGLDWDIAGIEAYNERCKQRLRDRGYGAVLHNDREYWLGICELDGEYREFVSVGAKRYAVRKLNGDVKITVAGVPKKGFQCLKDDLRNFKAGFIFDGETTGKKQHTYFYEEDITIDENGNERGDSIDLSPASYELDSVRHVDWERIFVDEIEIQTYDENHVL